MRLESIKLETSLTEISNVPAVKVAGEIDVYTAPDFKAAINKAIDSGAVNLIIDLTDVSYMDSSGFGAILGATKRVRPKGGSMNLVGCNEAIERMLRITRLDTIFGMFPDLESAVAAIKAKS